MRKLYNSKAFWLVIALLASLSLWIYVISQETEAYKQTFRGVKVELVGEDILLNSRNMVITDRSTATVTVEVSGPRRIVGSWSSDDLIAQVDVSKLTQPALREQAYAACLYLAAIYDQIPRRDGYKQLENRIEDARNDQLHGFGSDKKGRSGRRQL